MRIEHIGTGDTVEQAYENAKLALIAEGAPEDAPFQRDIIQFNKNKLFGLIKEPAKVLVWYEKAEPKAAAPAHTERTERPANKKPEAPAQKKPDAPAQKKPEAPVQKKNDAPAPKKQNAPKKTEAAPAAEAQPEEKRNPLPLPENDAAAAYIRTIVTGMGIESCEITLEQVEGTDEFIYNVEAGSANGSLIGNKGETLDAIQYLVRLSVNRGVDEENHRKISVNAGNYRAKRNGNLRALAARQARQVLKYGRSAALEPMSAYERRIIHTTVQGIEGVTSHSVGSDANRRVIISLEEGVQPTNPGRSGGRGGDRGGRNSGGRGGDRGGDRGGRGGGRGFQKREPYKPAVTREPRKDSEGSLYGRIEIPVKNDGET